MCPIFFVKGVFTISLDFELHWGGVEKWPLIKYDQYFLNTRKVIPQILSLFEEYDVHATWATVGMLFHDSKEQLLNNAPALKPRYAQENLSTWNYIERVGIGNDEQSDPFHYAPSLIRQILKTSKQELATHTFSHYYCNEEGPGIEDFRNDLRAAQRAAAHYGKGLRSLVFPRNQFNDRYLRVCYEEGITAVRSNPLDWFWAINSTQNESWWKRLNRGADAYLPVGKHNTYRMHDIEVREGYPLCIPASRLLRPYRPQELLLNNIKIERIKYEMDRAASNNEVYHLWWHPHNFGNYPDKNLQHLESILQHFRKKKLQSGMRSCSMSEISEELLNQR